MGNKMPKASAGLRKWLFTAGFIVLVLTISVGFNAGAAPTGTEVGGSITTNTTWTLAGSPYIVVNNVTVQPSATLTIQPGVKVLFNYGKRLRIEGLLFAQGNPANPITFTANDPKGYPGYWSGIYFKDSGSAQNESEITDAALGNILQYCVVELAGETNTGAVLIEDSAILVDHCTVQNNNRSGIRVSSNSGLAVGISQNQVRYNSISGDGAGIYGIDSSITDNVVMNNAATGDGAGIYALDSSVRDNIVGHNKASDDAGGIYASGSFVSGNFVYENSGDEAGGVYSLNNTLTGNTIVRNKSARYGAGLYFIGSGLFNQNTIVGNTSAAGYAYGGVVISGTPTVNYNNFYANAPFDMVVQSATNLNGENNYWGTADSGVILARIFDAFDDPSRGLFDFTPFLLDATFPVPTPLNLHGTPSGNSMSLSWNAIPGTSATYGYKVHYAKAVSGPPYDGTGLPEGNSPIDVGSATNLTLTGLNGGYIFVVTAYDSLNQMSWYSNQVDNLTRIFLPAVEQ